MTLVVYYSIPYHWNGYINIFCNIYNFPLHSLMVWGSGIILDLKITELLGKNNTIKWFWQFITVFHTTNIDMNIYINILTTVFHFECVSSISILLYYTTPSKWKDRSYKCWSEHKYTSRASVIRGLIAFSFSNEI